MLKCSLFYHVDTDVELCLLHLYTDLSFKVRCDVSWCQVALWCNVLTSWVPHFVCIMLAHKKKTSF